MSYQGSEWSISQDEQESNDRRKAGRYTLTEAADALAQGTGERADEVLEKLKAAVRREAIEKGAGLVVHEPGKNGTYKSKVVRGFYEEACWDDLNAWLGDNETRITWRFPAPPAAPVPPSAEQDGNLGDGRRARQISAILAEISRREWDPLAVPRGGKTAVRTACLEDAALFTEDAFRRAWQAAVNAGSVRMKDHEVYSGG